MATKSSKVQVGTISMLGLRELGLTVRRDTHCVDGAEWHRHGPEFPGTRGLCSDMVRDAAAQFAPPDTVR
jgi:hypothetical protein